MKRVRIGNGCGFWGDNLDAPESLARHGRLDYLTLEYLAELTLSILALQKQRDSSQIPLVPVMLRHQNFPVASRNDWDGLRMEAMDRFERTTPNEMDLQFVGDGSSLEVTVEYAAPLFSEMTIRRMLDHHEKVMEFMLASSSSSEDDDLQVA